MRVTVKEVTKWNPKIEFSYLYGILISLWVLGINVVAELGHPINCTKEKDNTFFAGPQYLHDQEYPSLEFGLTILIPKDPKPSSQIFHLLLQYLSIKLEILYLSIIL